MSNKVAKYPIKKDDHHMTIDDFIRECRHYNFIDDDGFGEYATETEKTDIRIDPSDVTSNNIDFTYTHVVWYNR
jgi:hypothetical protein